MRIKDVTQEIYRISCALDFSNFKKIFEIERLGNIFKILDFVSTEYVCG